MEDSTMKKTYMKPAIEVANMEPHDIICTSFGTKSLNSTDGFELSDELDEDDV